MPANPHPFTLMAVDKLADAGLDYVNGQKDARVLDRSDLVALKKEGGKRRWMRCWGRCWRRGGSTR